VSMFGESTWILVFVIIGLLGAVAVWRALDYHEELSRPGSWGSALCGLLSFFRLSVDARRAVVRQELGQSWPTRRDGAH
jgi:hypothetical protein